MSGFINRVDKVILQEIRVLAVEFVYGGQITVPTPLTKPNIHSSPWCVILSSSSFPSALQSYAVMPCFFLFSSLCGQCNSIFSFGSHHCT